MPPQVSIGLPVYNGERYLRETLDSVLAQTFEDFEVVISDNASTDKTQDICQAYAARDARIRYFRNARNVGSAMNFNRVFELSSAPYFKLANADDLSAPELVARCLAVLNDHSEVVLAYARTTLIDEHGVSLGRYDDRLDIRSPCAPDRFRQVMDRLGLMNVLQGLTRSSALRRTGLLGPYLGSDLVLVAELALYGQFWEVPEPLFFRRMHPDALSGLKNSERQWEYVAPQAKGGLHLYRWRLLREYLAAVSRSPLPVADRLTLLARIARGAISSRDEFFAELRTVPSWLLRAKPPGRRE
jgi:glycosyltransferase involved in cell wall biosynthesis